MRPKCNSRREEIIELATQLFSETGYTGMTMSTISRHMGGSKGTLYAYFSNKEDLFSAIISAVGRKWGALLPLLPAENPSLKYDLLQFGIAYLELASSPAVLMVRRTVIAEAARAHFDAEFFLESVLSMTENYMMQMIIRGDIYEADAMIAARALIGILDFSLINPLLLGIDVERGIVEAASSSVEMFLRCYAAMVD